MRFATIFAGYLIALAIDSDALYENLSIFFVVVIMFVSLYLDIVTLSFDNIQQLVKLVKENKNDKEYKSE